MTEPLKTGGQARLFMVIGLPLGIGIGVATDHVGLGVAFGLGLGVVGGIIVGRVKAKHGSDSA